MPGRLFNGELPPKHHLALRGPSGALRYEECFTRSGFEGAYTILYHLHRPQALSAAPTGHVCVASKRAEPLAEPEPPFTLRRRHYRKGRAPGEAPAATRAPAATSSSPIDARVPLLFNDDVTIGTIHASESDGAYFSDGDGDELVFVRSGRGVLRSVFGDLRFGPMDYVYVPKGTPYRFELDGGPLDALYVECRGGAGLPRHFLNEAGQIRMDAPYSHRDFRTPEFRGPVDEGLREVVIKRHDAFHGFRSQNSPLDVVGWDGAVYPWAFPILAFQPRVSSVHLPPTWHATFAARGALVSSFVPRPLEFHPDAVTCPYPHASVDVDEVIYYVSGDFVSHSGVSEGSITWHPAGIPHGPHPGRYEASAGTKGPRRTEEIAVMFDCERPLAATAQARNVEDPSYDGSFASPG
jgi:homogentisate 1,2-dioxygenase